MALRWFWRFAGFGARWRSLVLSLRLRSLVLVLACARWFWCFACASLVLALAHYLQYYKLI